MLSPFYLRNIDLTLYDPKINKGHPLVTSNTSTNFEVNKSNKLPVINQKESGLQTDQFTDQPTWAELYARPLTEREEWGM